MTPKEPSSSGFKKWLDLLQQESWQLELIISGFSIFGLFQIFDPIREKVALMQSADKEILASLLVGVGFAVMICILNLCIHVILRGLWVGALGLRYVSGEIEFDQLNYHKWFDRFLRKRIKSFDHFISRLEDYCSIMFAIAFLSIFFILSLFLVSILIALLGTTFSNEALPEWVNVVVIVLISFIGTSMFFTFLDFLTLGLFKRKKWIAVWYYPIYRFYSIISLSFLYRPLIYNFLDNKFSRRIFVLLLPIYIGLVVLSSIDYQSSNYFNTVSTQSGFNRNSEYVATKNSYLDQLTENYDIVRFVAIPSRRIQEKSLPVFIPFNEDYEAELLEINPELKVKKDITGLTMQGAISIGQSMDSIARSKFPVYIDKLNSFFTIKLDSIEQKTDFVIVRNKKKQLGFETVVDLQNLARGKHVLHYSRKSNRRVRIPEGKRTDPEVKSKDSIVDRKIAAIPFWYYPD